MGREAIVASIGGWLEANPEARLAIRLTGVKALGTTAARVRGVMSFTRKPGVKPIETRFESLRVLEGATWRLAESTVEPSQVDALESLGWMVGTWRATDPDSGATIDASYQRVAGGHVILGGIRHRARPRRPPRHRDRRRRTCPSRQGDRECPLVGLRFHRCSGRGGF